MTIFSSRTQITKESCRKPRTSIPRPSGIELIKVFWAAPIEAFFGQEVIAPVSNKSIKTLESDRWRGLGIPYRKIGGRVLYQKQDVVRWLESHALVTSTSEYKQEVKHA